MKTLEEVIEWIEARVVRDGSCLIWQHAMRGGVPQAQLPDDDGKWKTANVRRVIWSARFGRPPKKSFVVVCTCDSPLCVNPAHLKETSRSQMLKGRPKTAAGRLAITLAARTKKNAKLTAEQVKEIRQSDESGQKIAERMGISRSHVHGIRMGKWCREVVGNPFAGLGA